MQKYGIKHPENYLESEINKFLQGEKLTDEDLKNLDEKLRKLLSNKMKQDTLKKK